MKKEQAHMNRMWWIASAAVLLFVALAVVPVAAFDWPGGNNDTNISVANTIMYNFFGDGKYYYNLTNVTGGQKAIHVSSDYQSLSGQCTQTSATSGTFYITSTGGRQYEDDIVLLVAVNSTDETDLSGFEINITSSGYTWDPKYDKPDKKGAPPQSVLTWNAPAVNEVFDNTDYLESGGVDITQNWKFAPTANYPIFCGQSVTTEGPFKVIPIDLRVGVIANSTYNSTLNNWGMAKVDYNIISPDPFSGTAKIAFNAYAYNNWTTEGGHQINWINSVNTSAQSPSSSYSGWLVTPPL